MGRPFGGPCRDGLSQVQGTEDVSMDPGPVSPTAGAWPSPQGSPGPALEELSRASCLHPQWTVLRAETQVLPAAVAASAHPAWGQPQQCRGWGVSQVTPTPMKGTLLALAPHYFETYRSSWGGGGAVQVQ